MKSLLAYVVFDKIDENISYLYVPNSVILTFSGSQVINFDEKEELELDNENELDDLSENPNSNRMLKEAYTWHNSGEETNVTDKDAYPVLVIANTLDYSSKFESPIYLDTYDLTLKVGGRIIKLPSGSNGSGKEELEIWRDFVLGQEILKGFDKDLRFYPRKVLDIN